MYFARSRMHLFHCQRLSLPLPPPLFLFLPGRARVSGFCGRGCRRCKARQSFCPRGSEQCYELEQSRLSRPLQLSIYALTRWSLRRTRKKDGEMERKPRPKATYDDDSLSSVSRQPSFARSFRSFGLRRNAQSRYVSIHS